MTQVDQHSYYDLQAEEPTRPGINPLLLAMLAVVALGGGAYYFLQQPGVSPPVQLPIPQAVVDTPRPAQAVPAPPLPVSSGGLIPVTSVRLVQRQAVDAAGKEDPFRTLIIAPPAIAAAIPRLLVVPSPARPARPAPSAPPIQPKIARSINVVGIIATPEDTYAVLTYEGRNEIVRPGDVIEDARVMTISAQTRTVVFQEKGEEIPRSLEVGP